MRKALIIIGFVALFLLLVFSGIGGWAYYTFLYTPPLTQEEIDELGVDWDEVTHGNWSPWWDPGTGELVWNPGASFNAWLTGVPEEDKAWPRMLEVYYAHKALFDHEYMGTNPEDTRDWAQLTPALATPEADAALAGAIEAMHLPVMGAWWHNTDMEPYEHAAQVAYAEANPEPAPGERQVFHPGPMTFNPDENVAMIQVLLPTLGRQRNFTNFAKSKGMYELQQGNAEDFVAAMEASLAVSDLSVEIPTLIGVLVETAIENVAVSTIDWGLANHRELFDEALLARLERALAAHADARYLWQGEALMVNDTLRRLSDDRGALRLNVMGAVNSDTLYTGGAFEQPVSLPEDEMHASAQRAILVDVRMLRLAVDQSVVPWDGQATNGWQVFEAERDKLNFVTAQFLEIMLPALERAAQNVRQHTQEVIGLRVGIAAHRHFERHGVYPKALEEIDDDLLTFDPVDVFTGEALGYVLSADGPVVYSVGDDRTDDGGLIRWTYDGLNPEGNRRRVPPEIEWHSAQRAAELRLNVPESIVGDWVLFPRPREDPEAPDDYDPDWDLKQDGMFNEESGAKNAPASEEAQPGDEEG